MMASLHGITVDAAQLRHEFGQEAFSAKTILDWLLTGECALAGTSGIDLDFPRTIRLQIGLASAALMEDTPTAKALLLIRDDRLQEAIAQPDIAQFLEAVAPADADSDLALELYNGHC